jgi:lysophospholipase L1-like esterase
MGYPDHLWDSAIMKKAILSLIIFLFLAQAHYSYAWYQTNGVYPQVVFIGDSITASIKSELKYPTEVCTKFNNLCSYLNKGVSGDTTTQVVARWAADVVANHPRYAVILMGTNDVGTSVEYSAFIANYTTVLDSCRDNGIIPVVIAMTPWESTNEMLQTRDTWNTGLETLVKTYATYIWINCNSSIGRFRVGGDPGNLWDFQAGYTADGLHMTELGVQVFSACVESSIAASGYFVWTNGLRFGFNGVSR